MSMVDDIYEFEEYVRSLGERLGRIEAKHGRHSPQYKEALDEWRDLQNRCSDIASAIRELADTIRAVQDEYDL